MIENKSYHQIKQEEHDKICAELQDEISISKRSKEIADRVIKYWEEIEEKKERDRKKRVNILSGFVYAAIIVCLCIFALVAYNTFI